VRYTIGATALLQKGAQDYAEKQQQQQSPALPRMLNQARLPMTSPQLDMAALPQRTGHRSALWHKEPSVRNICRALDVFR
jgi:hypothetical protein